MNVYRATMFKAYWGPITPFYGLPCLFLMDSGPSAFYMHNLASMMAPVFILFFTGYFLAPIVGPKVKNNKLMSFIMAYSCLAAFTLVWIVILTFFEGITFSGIIFGVVFIFIYGSFPIIISAALFIRFCKTVPAGS